MTTHVQAKAANSTARVSDGGRGVVFIHSCPRAISPHLEWAVSGVFGTNVRLDWTEQPVAPGTVRAEILWQGPRGTSAKLASALLAFHQVRYEVTEDASGQRPGERFAATPALGLFRADIGEHGDVMVAEERLRTALQHAAAGDAELADEIARLIGGPWDDELEPFRCAHEGSTVRLLHDVI
ncbi:MAG: DUF3145 domain-containing protein [Candidatus Nanopelagicales bacterium]|nr:DUF3145 domain-containing protein [Candidatus Nanopelagicales bacterium]